MAKIVVAASKIDQNVAQEHPKPIKVMPRNALKWILEKGSVSGWPRGAACLMFFCIFDATWAILGAI